MNQEKIGQFIKEIRKNNNLTQSQFADLLGVTYQAVSKWENSKSIPDIGTMKLISKTFNVEISEILEGEKNNKKKNPKIFVIGIILMVIVIAIMLGIVHYNRHHHDFEFKTLGTTCSDFTINGSAAYNYDKTFIYISNVNYCGKDSNKIYDLVECNLYEDYNDTKTLVSKCDHSSQNITLEDYLKNVEINVDNYSSVCKKFNESSLYLEITMHKDGEIKSHKIPLTLKNNC